MGLDLLCASLIALLFGLAVCFAGYRFFLALLPIWGFFFGFALGAQALQALFGIGILATTGLGGAGLIVGTLVLGASGLSLARMFTDPVRLILQNSPFWAIAFVVLAGAGIALQIVATREMELEFEDQYAGRI